MSGMAERKRISGRRITVLRSRWAPRVATGLVTCPRCTLPITTAQPWDLGHRHDLALGGDPAGAMVPEHSSCNRAAGARLGHTLRRAPSRRLEAWL